MIKENKPGDVFYHEPTKQWVRVINKKVLCEACAFGAGEDCFVYASEAVKCQKYGYVRAKRPKNTIHASELTGGHKSQDKAAEIIDCLSKKIERAYGKAIVNTSPLRPTKEFAVLDTKEPQKEHKPIEPTKCWIVCLFFGGKLLPSAMPKQHKSLHSAMMESKRLAKLHDKTFIVLRAELVTQNVRVPMVDRL